MDKELKNRGDRKAWYLIVIGIILMPIFLCTFIIDRFMMVFMVMSDAPDIVEYFQDMKYIGISLLRNLTTFLVALFIWWL